MQKLAIVTGGNTGLGKQTAIRLAGAGFKIVLGCRNIQKGNETAAHLSKSNPAIKVEVRHLDLADLDSVANFARNQKFTWDLLVNNAGAKIEHPAKKTMQGYEWHIGVNHLGHFALTSDLWSKASATARVVTVSSIVARNGELNFFSKDSEFSASIQYANSKLMNLAFATALARKLAGSTRSSTAAHPGFARAEAYGNVGVRIAEYLFAQSAKSGSIPIFEACFSNNGAYLAPRVMELWSGFKDGYIKDISEENSDEFWNTSEQLTGRIFRP